MSGYFKELVGGTWSLAVGLGITFRYMLKPVVTVQYPHETIPMSPRFRGHIELVGDEESGAAKCVACGMCQKACPSKCISLRGEKNAETKKRMVTSYTLDFTRCSLCGSCVESCKFGAIEFSSEYNLAGPRKEAYVFDLVKRLEDRRR